MIKKLLCCVIAILSLFVTACGDREYGENGGGNITETPEGIILDEREGALQMSGEVAVRIPDPHVLLDGDTYYMYGTGVNYAYKSADMKNWEKTGAIYSDSPYVYTGGENDSVNQKLFNFWSPDVYKMNGKYYMFVTGPVAAENPTDYENSQLYISVYVSEANSPLGPFDKFVLIQPREKNIKAPHSVVKNDSPQTIYSKDYEFYNTLRVDFHTFTDPKDNKLYFTYTGYGNKNDREEAGNHIVITEFKNPQFVGEGENPGMFYDFVEESYIHASNPLDWPEFGDTIKTVLDKDGNVWMPYGGFPRGVTEAPSLAYQNGWYQLYFSCNTWDSPEYQIVCIMVKDLKDFDIETRKSLKDSEKRVGRFAIPKKSNGSWANYGSGGIFKDKKGKLRYAYHITYPTYQRDVIIKEIVW